MKLNDVGIFFDRDGTINVDADYLSDPDDLELIPGAVEAIRDANRLGVKAFVITNQSGVARGLYDEQTLAAIHAHMRERVRTAGGELAGIWYCPHLPDAGCDCRKPRPGLFRQLERDLRVSVRGAPYIGDRISDVQAAEGAGASPILVRTGTGAETESVLGKTVVPVYDDLWAAARALLDETR